MPQKTQFTGLFFLAAALVSIILLAASLSNLQLHPGTPFPFAGSSENADTSAAAVPPVENYSLPILQGFFALIFVILMIYVPVRLIELVNIKKILGLALALVFVFILVNMLPSILPGQSEYLSNEPSGIVIPPSINYSVTPLGQPPQGLVWAVAIAFGLGMVLLGFRLIQRRPDPGTAEDPLLQEAEAAVNALHAGMDLRNVILRCYLQMARSLQEEQGIGREYNMTAREFEDLLGLKGFPPAPVNQLTCLFEKVRYGNGPASKEDEMIAVESLNEIIQFCHNAGVYLDD